MRVRSLHRRLAAEDGATAVFLALVLVVLIAIMALTIDGGQLLGKYRRARNANDAAALAAALSCARNEGLSAANTQANAVAVANMSDAAQTVANNYYTTGCTPSAGKVTVRYGGFQTLNFAPAVGISSPKPVVARATAVWGGAGGADGVVPAMISFRNTDCNIPNGTPPQTCHFWYDEDFTGLATFGLMNLSTWGSTAACPPGASGADLNGWSTPLILETSPTYVCALNSTSVHANVLTQIRNDAPREYTFPVNSPSQQVPPCANSATTCASPERFAIIGFAQMTVTRVENNNQAQTLCGGVQSPGSGGNYRCVEAVWTGFDSGGYRPGGGSNFGVIAVGIED